MMVSTDNCPCNDCDLLCVVHTEILAEFTSDS